MRYCRRSFKKRWNAGVAAVEFALIAPVFIIALAGVVDLGGELYAKMRLEASVDAAANYAIVNASKVTSTSGGSLASQIATIVTGVNSGMTENATVVVNNGPSVTVTNGTTTSGGTASGADHCYCPTGSVPNWTWGSAVTCGAICSDGTVAGKFVTVTASYDYAPILSGYSFAPGGTLTIGTLVETQ